MCRLQFEITENYQPYSLWEKIWEVISGLLTIFYVPFAYGKHLLDKLRGIEEPEDREEDVWLLHAKFSDYQIESFAIDSDKAANLVLSEVYDFPDWKDWDSPLMYLLKFRSTPEIKALENVLFGDNDLMTEDGLYLIRVNKKGRKMTLCLLTSAKPALIEVTQLKPLSWHLEATETGIALTGNADQGIHEVKIIVTRSTPTGGPVRS